MKVGTLESIGMKGTREISAVLISRVAVVSPFTCRWDFLAACPLLSRKAEHMYCTVQQLVGSVRQESSDRTRRGEPWRHFPSVRAGLD